MEHLQLTFVSVVLITLGACQGNPSLEIDEKTAAFKLSINNQTWLNGADIFMFSRSVQYSVERGDLLLSDKKTEHGMDNLGFYTVEAFHFTAIGHPMPLPHNVTFKVMFKTYTDLPIVLFGQHFIEGVPDTRTGDKNSVCTGFPGFTVDKSVDLGFLAYGGIMFGDTQKSLGKWKTDTKHIASGLDSGPLVLFDEKKNTLIVSSFENFMAGSAMYKVANDTTAYWGIMGSATSIPEDFSYWTVMYYSAEGINVAMEGWGKTLRQYYNRDTTSRDSDFVNNYLGYWTDNGAYYYYITETGKSYEQTLLDVYDYSKKEGLPYRYIQFDSWWYPKGPDQGVTEWVPMPAIFPHGLQYFWNKTGWPNIAHNRWWSAKTGYAKQNGGQFEFLIDPSSSHAIPVDDTFWDYLMKTSKEWGLLVYEQDWLNVEFDNTKQFNEDITLGRLWLRQMGNAASKNGLTIQYCMSPSRHALQSLEIPAVSQARVSGDYGPGNSQWKIGISSIFAHAIAIAPFKDNFWTTSNQTGNKYGKSEPYPALENVVSLLSTGPVGPADKIGHADVALIMRACNAEGLLLKPNKPALAVDKQIMQAAFNGFQGEVWSTYSQVSNLAFGIVFGADFGSGESMSLTPAEAGWETPFPESKLFSVYSPTTLQAFSADAPLVLKNCSKSHFCLYYTTPVLTVGGKELLLHGDLSKWAPMSRQRMRTIRVSDSDVLIILDGAVGEKVTFTFMYDGKVSDVTCVMSKAGSAKLSVIKKMCSPLA